MGRIMKKPILVTYQCAECRAVHEQSYDSGVGTIVPTPILPKGWRDFGEKGYFCHNHKISWQSSLKPFPSYLRSTKFDSKASTPSQTESRESEEEGQWGLDLTPSSTDETRLED